jgi:SAM-dependent methyltransferase
MSIYRWIGGSLMAEQNTQADIREVVRQRYGQLAADFQPSGQASCCEPAGSACCSPSTSGTIQLDDLAAGLYETPDVALLPAEVTGLSLGCGDPVTLAGLQPGQTVLDLGSGGGIDCFLAARQVGPTGTVIGVDMTPAMLDRARANQMKLGLDNVEFRLGEIEHLPVADDSVDIILSNCVINLSPDKPQVLREAYRVLRPGGRLAVSDIVTSGPLPALIKQSLSAWVGCVAGALELSEYVAFLEAAGFQDVDVRPVYLSTEMLAEAAEQLSEEIDLVQVDEQALSRSVFSAKITAHKR